MSTTMSAMTTTTTMVSDEFDYFASGKKPMMMMMPTMRYGRVRCYYPMIDAGVEGVDSYIRRFVGSSLSWPIFRIGVVLADSVDRWVTIFLCKKEYQIHAMLRNAVLKATRGDNVLLQKIRDGGSIQLTG